jgi:hypothetical protein
MPKVKSRIQLFLNEHEISCPITCVQQLDTLDDTHMRHFVVFIYF